MSIAYKASSSSFAPSFLGLVLAGAAILFAAEGTARADDTAGAPAVTESASPSQTLFMPPPAPVHEVAEWYGWQTLIVDGASMGAEGIALGTDSKAFFWSGVAGYTLGAPIVHAAHGRWATALADLGLRAGAVALGGAVGYAAGGASGTQMCDGSPCWIQPPAVGLVLGAIVGGVAASAIDSALLSREMKPAASDAPPVAFSWTPSIDPVKGGATGGISPAGSDRSATAGQNACFCTRGTRCDSRSSGSGRFIYRMRRRSIAACVLWCSLVGGGFVWIARARLASGAVAIAPARWPGGVALQRATDRPTLLVTLHPQCPCSRATVNELERLMRDRAGNVDLRVLFVRPRGLVDDPARSSLWERVARIPGARAQVDEGGVIAAAFGAFTSGQVFLYDTSGELLFSGGITASRGHEGDNAGRDAVESLLDRKNAPAHTPVFGCSLFGERK